MAIDIQSIIDRLPSRIKELHDSAFDLTYRSNELNVEAIDSATLLLAIVRKGGGFDTPAGRLASLGVGEAQITRCIIQNIPRRVPGKPDRKRSPHGEVRQAEIVVKYTDAAKELLNFLHLRRDNNNLYTLLDGIVTRRNPIVEQIFGSVNLSVPEARVVLQLPPVVYYTARRA